MAPKTTLSHWDPSLLVSQIVAMQTLHYLTLSIFTPLLLSIFAEQSSLQYEGGAANVGEEFALPENINFSDSSGMIMDWREMAGRPTVRGFQGEERWSAYSWVWSGGKRIGHGLSQNAWDGRTDSVRGWIIALCWIIACSADIFYLYFLIRRPRLILDFALTLVFNHFVLTSYYSASLPTSFFFWAVILGGALLTVVVAEHLCVKREMHEGLTVIPIRAQEEAPDEMEMGLLSRRD